MTPKEKANELVFKYQRLVTTWDCYNDCDIEIEDRMPEMKECALIAVDEILELDVVWYDLQIVKDYPKTYKHNQTFEYWEEVKQQIEKL